MSYAPPASAPNNPDYPAQVHQPLIHQQYSTMTNVLPTMTQARPSCDPNLQHFDQLLVAPTCTVAINDENTFDIKVFADAHFAAPLEFTAKQNDRLIGISVTLTTKTGIDLIKIQRNTFGGRYLVKSPHNNNFQIGSIETNYMKNEFKLFNSWEGVAPVITMKVSGSKYFCMVRRIGFFKADTDVKIGSMEEDARGWRLQFHRDFEQDAKLKTIAMCSSLLYTMLG